MPAPREREADVRRALDRLASLRVDPAARAKVAVELLSVTSRADVIYPCAQSLEEHPLPEGRGALLAAYARIAADAKKLDSGGALRAAILRALRHVAGRDDIAFLESAANTYERSVQGPGATELRAAALVTLLEVEPALASLHAVRILSEGDDTISRTQRGTGEPAATAARVLGAAGETLALYYAVLRPWEPPEEVIAECLRQLHELPGAALAGIITLYAGTGSDTIQLGLVDLVTANPNTANASAIAAWLQGCDPDIYRYALTSFIASRRTDLHNLVARLVEQEFNRDRLAIAAEALESARGVPELEAARKSVTQRLTRE